MTETGWMIVTLVAVIAVILAIVMIRRRRPADGIAAAPMAADLLPEQVALPTSEPKALADSTPSQEPLASIVVPVDAVPSVAPVADAAVTISAPPAPAPVPTEGDNLLRLKGVGPKIATLLNAQGITHFAQIAAWTDTDLAVIDAKLGAFAGRPTRDNWIDQSRLLAAGDVAGYEAKYGKL